MAAASVSWAAPNRAGRERRRAGRDRPGFTLTELLVAIAIMVLVTFIGVPLVMALLGDLQGKGVSGATRLLDTSFSLARDQALRSHAPFGVRLVRDAANPWTVGRLQYLQSPPTYSLGRVTVAPDVNSNLMVDSTPAPNFIDDDGDGFIDEWDELSEAYIVVGTPTTQWLGVVRVGDHIRVNNSGPLYQVIGPDFNPVDGIVDAYADPPSNTVPGPPLTPGSVLFVCAEPFPNRDGPGGLPQCKGFTQSQSGVPYELFRQPVPADGLEEVLLPDGIVIDVLNSKGLPNRLPFNWPLLMGPDGRPGTAGVDDDGNGVTDWIVPNMVPDWGELGLGDDVRPPAWPPIDILFSPNGQVTGDAAQAAVMHLWVGPFGTTQSRLPDDLARARLFSLYTRGGTSQVNEIDGRDLNPPFGVLDNPYSFAEQALGTTPE